MKLPCPQGAVVGVLVLLVVTLACADPRTLLWVPPEATILRAAVSHPSGNADVAFTVPIADLDQKEVFTARLSQQFEQSGWRRRTHQYMNPTFVTSFQDGWTRSGIGVRLPGAVPSTAAYNWHGEWEDAQGDVLLYSLYASKLQVRVYAAYVPVRLVRAGPNGDYR